MNPYIVDTTQISIKTWADTPEAAVEQVLLAENAPENALLGVYLANPTPKANCQYGAPMGRMSSRLDPDGRHKAKALDLDEGYDEGGAYWGLRPDGLSLYAVQDGVGNLTFVDARSEQAAIEEAIA